MAAYAALVSLMNNSEHIQNHRRLSTSLDKKQLESLGEKVDFFVDFIESYNYHGSSKKVEDLESQIASVAHAAEDVIESHIVDQIHAGSNRKCLRCLLDLQKVIEDMDSIKEKVMKFKEEMRLKDYQPKHSKSAASSRPQITGKTTMVGFDGYLNQLLDGLTRQQSDRQIIPIIGMGGSGKTTLARNVYENLLIVQHFDVRAWVTVSQEYNVREILFEALSCLGESPRELDKKIEDQLGEHLHKVLFGRRYLIILDDMWSVEAWNKLKFFFPENGNRSRIVVTTRQLDVANHFGSLGLIALKFLDDNKSWDLFCEKAYPQEGCPPELKEIGKKLVKKCKGLPLSIVVIGGLFGNSSKTQEYWENVVKDLSSIVNLAEDNQCLNILSLSYSHLPACLKPCFLYLGIFSKGHEIHVSRLIKILVAEGFIKQKIEQSLEDIAEGYIKDLIDRNLILVRRLHRNGKVKTCYIHDLLGDLCIKVAEKEKFFFVMRELDTAQDIDREHRIIIHDSIGKKKHHRQVFHTLKSTLLARSVISYRLPRHFLLKSRLLRVMPNAYGDCLDTTFQQVNLRFLEWDPRIQYGRDVDTYELPSSISLLWNLQTLIMGVCLVKDFVAPSEIWEMPQLRHLVCHRICLPDPPPSDEQDGFILRNLQTLGEVKNLRFSEEVCKRTPNIKKLHINYSYSLKEGHTMSYYCLYNIGRLNKLESLHYEFDEVPHRDDVLQNLKFPSSLKKLTLKKLELIWDDLAVIGSLPHLEVLILNPDSVIGREWNPVDGGFRCLKFLRICWCRLKYWNADRSHFPVLENLDLSGVIELEEIPSEIGEIPTVREIRVSNCSISVAISAVEILKEQENLENQGLQVRIYCWDWNETQREEFREKVEQEGFTSQNLHVN